MNFDLKFLFLCCIVVQVQSCDNYFKCLGDMLQDYFVPKNVNVVEDICSDNNTQLIDTQLNDNDTFIEVDDLRNDTISFFDLSLLGKTLTQALTNFANLIRDELNSEFNVDKEVDVHKNIENNTIIFVKAFSFGEKDNNTDENNKNSNFNEKYSDAYENNENATKNVEIPNIVKNNLTEINDELSELKIPVENNLKAEIDAYISKVLDNDSLDWVSVPNKSFYNKEYTTTENKETGRDIQRDGNEVITTETPEKDVITDKEVVLITSETKAPIYTAKYPRVFIKSITVEPEIKDTTKNISNNIVANLTTTTKLPVFTTKQPIIFAKRKELDEKKGKTKKTVTKYVMITTHNNINEIRTGKSLNNNTTSSNFITINANKSKEFDKNTDVYSSTPKYNVISIVTPAKDIDTSKSPLATDNEFETKTGNAMEKEAQIEQTTHKTFDTNKPCKEVRSPIFLLIPSYLPLHLLTLRKISETATKNSDPIGNGDQTNENTTSFARNIKGYAKQADFHLSTYDDSNIEVSTIKDTTPTSNLYLPTTKRNEIATKTSDPTDKLDGIDENLEIFIKRIKGYNKKTDVNAPVFNATKIEASTSKYTCCLPTTKINKIATKIGDATEKGDQVKENATSFITKNINGHRQHKILYSPIFILRQIEASTIKDYSTYSTAVPITKINETETRDTTQKRDQIETNTTVFTKNIKGREDTNVYSSTSNNRNIEASAPYLPLKTTKINEIETETTDPTEKDTQIEAQTKTPINYNQHQPIDYKLIENFIMNEVGREDSNNNSQEDNATDYPAIDYVELYKDTTNEPVEYIPTAVPKHYGVDYEVLEYNGEDSAVPPLLPWLAAIFIKNGTNNQFDYVCDGALLTDSTVLTAATCFLGPNETVAADDIIVFLGKRSLQVTDETETIHKVQKLTLHHNLTVHGETAVNDLAILLLENPAVISDSIAPACIGEGEVGEAYTTAWGANLSPIRLTDTNKSCHSGESTDGDNLFCATYRNEVVNCPSYGSVYYSASNTTEGLNTCIYGIRTTLEPRSGICFHKDVTYTDLSRYKVWLNKDK